MNEQSIFIAALERERAERPQFVAEACGDNDALKKRVEILLQAHENAGSVLDRPAMEPTTRGRSTTIIGRSLTIYRQQVTPPSIEYLAGGAVDDTYVEVEGVQRFYSCYTVAAQRVSEGEPHEAVELLRDGIKHAYFNCAEVDWARAFLKRLEDDPGWPRRRTGQ